MSTQFPSGSSPMQQRPAAPMQPQAAPQQSQFPMGATGGQPAPNQAPPAPTQSAPNAMTGGQSHVDVSSDPNNPQFGGRGDMEAPTDWKAEMEAIVADPNLKDMQFNPQLQTAQTEQFQQLANQWNPMQNIDQEQVQTILANQDAQGLMDLLSQVARAGFVNSLSGGQTIAARFATGATQQYSEFAGSQIARDRIVASMMDSNPNFASPQYQGHFNEVVNAFSRKYQGQELQRALEGYFNQLGGDWQLKSAAPLPEAAPKYNPNDFSGFNM